MATTLLFEQSVTHLGRVGMFPEAPVKVCKTIQIMSYCFASCVCVCVCVRSCALFVSNFSAHATYTSRITHHFEPEAKFELQFAVKKTNTSQGV